MKRHTRLKIGLIRRKESMGVLLEDQLNIMNVMELKERIKIELENSEALNIDGSHVFRVDATGLQLLLSAKNVCDKRSISWNWEGASGELLSAAQTLGLVEPLGLSDFVK